MFHVILGVLVKTRRERDLARTGKGPRARLTYASGACPSNAQGNLSNNLLLFSAAGIASYCQVVSGIYQNSQGETRDVCFVFILENFQN